jgi:hypothetical protein
MRMQKVRTYSATDRDMALLEAVATYHSFSKSATMGKVITKEVWRIFPARTERVAPDTGARIEEEMYDGNHCCTDPSPRY